MKIYLCGAAFIAALGATAGPAGAQAISGKPVQTAQAETTIYRTTVRERIFASISPLSPTISAFSLLISPRKRPSMRTVSLKESFPSNSEP